MLTPKENGLIYRSRCDAAIFITKLHKNSEHSFIHNENFINQQFPHQLFVQQLKIFLVFV